MEKKSNCCINLLHYILFHCCFFYDATVLKMTLYCTVHMLKLSVVILIVKLCFEEERSILQ